MIEFSYSDLISFGTELQDSIVSIVRISDVVPHTDSYAASQAPVWSFSLSYSTIYDSRSTTERFLAPMAPGRSVW